MEDIVFVLLLTCVVIVRSRDVSNLRKTEPEYIEESFVSVEKIDDAATYTIHIEHNLTVIETGDQPSCSNTQTFKEALDCFLEGLFDKRVGILVSITSAILLLASILWLIEKKCRGSEKLKSISDKEDKEKMLRIL